MSRARINNIIRDYAKSIGYNYDTGVVPTALAGGMAFPAIFWNAPDVKWSESKARWEYPSKFYIIADAGEQDITECLDTLQNHALALHRLIQSDARLFADTTFTCKPMYGFDNTTTGAIEVTLNIYCDGGC